MIVLHGTTHTPTNLFFPTASWLEILKTRIVPSVSIKLECAGLCMCVCVVCVCIHVQCVWCEVQFVNVCHKICAGRHGIAYILNVSPNSGHCVCCLGALI